MANYPGTCIDGKLPRHMDRWQTIHIQYAGIDGKLSRYAGIDGKLPRCRCSVDGKLSRYRY